LKQVLKWKSSGVLFSAASLLIAIVLSGLIMAAAGHNPFSAFAAIAVGAFGGVRQLANTLTQTTPLIFTGLAFVIARKASIINLGVEGQLYMGALGAALVGITDFGLPHALHLLFALLAGAVFGSLYAAIVGILKVKFGSNEVVATVMLNSIALLFVGFLLNGPLLAEGSAVDQTVRIQETAELPRVIAQYQLTMGIFLAIGACFFIKWLFERTTVGYDIRCVGLNKLASETAGIQTGRVIIISLCISGAIAGIAGAVHVLGVDRRLIFGFSPGFGFAGISVAALAAENILGIMLASLIFGAMRSGSLELARTTSVPAEFANVIQALVVLLVAAPMLVRELSKLGGFVKKGGGAIRRWTSSSKT